jgi:hypothetical protein
MSTWYNFKAPALPLSPIDYDQRQQDQFAYALRLYFNRLDEYNATIGGVVTPEGIVYPDGSLQVTAWNQSYIEAFDRTASIAVPTTPTLLIPGSFLPPVNEGITYDPLTGEFTFLYEGVYSLSISLNLKGSSGGQIVYVYAQKNVGAGWVNTTNSGKAYKLTNNVDIQFTNPQAVYRAAGEKTRYYIYASSSGPTLETQTLRIHFAGG